jgi:ribosomal protein S18 acetylase RimI-like enzyme
MVRIFIVFAHSSYRGCYYRCFKLLENNMSHLYETSTLGWTPKKKQQELNRNWARFLMVRDCAAAGKFIGYAFFRFDEDYNRAALYCYELHIVEEYRGRGIGTHLITILEEMAKSFNLEILILTTLTNNEPALKFYEKLGFELDESNKKNERSFKILSKKF